MTRLRLLKRFCEPAESSRDYLKEPFRDEQHAYGTDGKIMVRVPLVGVEGEIPPGSCHVFELIYDNLERAIRTRGKWIRLHALGTNQCQTCRGSGVLWECRACSGVGSGLYLHDGRSETVDCDVCLGNGVVSYREGVDAEPSKCHACGGSGEVLAEESRLVGTALLACCLLERLMKLPGLVMKAPRRRCDHGVPVLFRFDGGEGMIMPLRLTWPNVESDGDAEEDVVDEANWCDLDGQDPAP